MDEMIRSYIKGEIIFAEGIREDAMYALMKGSVGIYANYGKAGEKLLIELKEKDVSTFGEMGLLESMPRSATAVALTDVKVFYITGETFGSYFCDSPDAVLIIMKNMSKRIRALTQDYLDACRAVAEAVDYEKTGNKKSGWLLGKVDKFINDYEVALKEANSYGCDINGYFLSGQFW